MVSDNAQLGLVVIVGLANRLFEAWSKKKNIIIFYIQVSFLSIFFIDPLLCPSLQNFSVEILFTISTDSRQKLKHNILLALLLEGKIRVPL